MCGILASNGISVIANKLTEQLNRGVDGAGYALLTQDNKKIYGKGTNLFTTWGEFQYSWRTNKTRLGMFHHRYPTSTGNTEETAHPFTNPYNPNLIGIHNGVINNPRKVLEKTIEKCPNWWVGNDSQAIIFELSQAIICNNEKIKRKSDGYAAVMMMDLKHQKFYMYRDETASLYIHIDYDGNWLASSEIEEYNNNWLEVSPLSPNIIWEIETDTDGKFVDMHVKCQVFYEKKTVQSSNYFYSTTTSTYSGYQNSIQQYNEMMNNWTVTTTEKNYKSMKDIDLLEEYYETGEEQIIIELQRRYGSLELAIEKIESVQFQFVN